MDRSSANPMIKDLEDDQQPTPLKHDLHIDGVPK